MANEKRLVWTTDVMSFLCKRCNEIYEDEPCEPCDCLMLEELDKCPTVDAVEVVRCKDCGYWLHVEDGYGECTNRRFHLDGHPDPTMEFNGFCSCGERKAPATPKGE